MAANAAASMRASAWRERASLVSRWRLLRCAITALKTASPLSPLRYSMAYCHEMSAWVEAALVAAAPACASAVSVCQRLWHLRAPEVLERLPRTCRPNRHCRRFAHHQHRSRQSLGRRRHHRTSRGPPLNRPRHAAASPCQGSCLSCSSSCPCLPLCSHKQVRARELARGPRLSRVESRESALIARW